MTFNRREFISLTLLSSGAIVLPAFSKWVSKPSLPYRVQEIYPALHNNKIFVAGGLSPDSPQTGGVSSKVAVFDLKTEEWSFGNDLPEPRHHPYLISHNSQLYALSGFIQSEQGRWTASSDILIFDDKTLSWKKLNVGMPHPMCETVAMSFGSHIHIAGGRRPLGKTNGNWSDHSDTNQHWAFNPNTKKWIKKAPLPTARNSAASALIKGKWYVVGGRTVNGGNVSSNEVYDPETDSWHTKTPMPQAQGGLAAATIEDELYVFGGEYFDNGGGVYKKVWKYSPTIDRWEHVTDMLVPRHGLGAVSFNNKIFVIGGAKYPGGKGTSNEMTVWLVS
ncbi:Kelch repeat-containing protein [Pleionea sediminis]|uniref:Kelch repeat-containing protein n=1 Tax=Pleionea sediminis TaxID=2569479 RepID=UPI0011864F84|nr:kelch repeat-containing protein [Pleionea sediminis]